MEQRFTITLKAEDIGLLFRLLSENGSGELSVKRKLVAAIENGPDRTDEDKKQQGSMASANRSLLEQIEYAAHQIQNMDRPSATAERCHDLATMIRNGAEVLLERVYGVVNERGGPFVDRVDEPDDPRSSSSDKAGEQTYVHATGMAPVAVPIRGGGVNWTKPAAAPRASGAGGGKTFTPLSVVSRAGKLEFEGEQLHEPKCTCTDAESNDPDCPLHGGKAAKEPPLTSYEGVGYWQLSDGRYEITRTGGSPLFDVLPAKGPKGRNVCVTSHQVARDIVMGLRLVETMRQIGVKLQTRP